MEQILVVAMAMDVKDDTEQLELAEKELLALFPTVSAYILNLTDYVVDDMNKGNPQFKKRSRLAHARNMLVQAGLRESDDWVLWLDSGLISVPPDLIQQLLSAKKDVVTPLCLHHDVIRQKNVIYDLSTWRETHESYLQQKQLSMSDVLYTEKKPTKRIRLSDLRAEGRVVPVDGVGACALLVTANYFLNELGFPEKAFRHHIDTEGLAKMAQSMGYEVYGMPFVEVFH
nr:hypothetical protein BaRGS_034797 [Batillaria attramentaria]